MLMRGIRVLNCILAVDYSLIELLLVNLVGILSTSVLLFIYVTAVCRVMTAVEVTSCCFVLYMENIRVVHFTSHAATGQNTVLLQ